MQFCSLKKKCICVFNKTYWNCIKKACLKSFSSRSGPNTVQSKLKAWKQIFYQSNVSEADVSAEYIVSHVLGKKSISGVNAKQILNETYSKEIDLLCHKRLSNLPIQYVIEEWDFAGLTLAMKPPVFIPRPETHGLVDAVIHEVNTSSHPSFNVLEVGCGSGAISLALLKASNLGDISKPLKMTALDRDKNAVDLTRQNSSSTGLSELSILHCDIQSFSTDQLFHGMVSNPPYIPSQEMETLPQEIITYESKVALDGGYDGLDVINDIIDKASFLLSTNGWIWLEVDTHHPEKMKNLYKNFELVEVKKDLFDRDRFVKLVKVS